MRIILKLENRRGATLAVVAVSIVALLAVMSLAIDVGMMYSARAEAQRVADAAALAGASAYCDDQPLDAMSRAQQYVTSNAVLGNLVEVDEANIVLNAAASRVTVTIRREHIPTWFARIFGINEVAVAAMATAECGGAGAAECVRPWAVQDMWQEPGGVLPGDDDFYDPNEDTYIPVDPNNLNGFATGYGAASRGGDVGLQIRLKTPDPSPQSGDLAQPGPGVFMILDFEDDPTMTDCGLNPGGQTVPGGGQNGIYMNSICGCNRNPVHLGESHQVPVHYGNRSGPTGAGLAGLIAKDPTATWTADGPSNPNSERIVPIALMAPLGLAPGTPPHWNATTLPTVSFTNIALMFIESYDTHQNQTEIVGRFMRYATGMPGEVTGSGVKYLRLVE